MDRSTDLVPSARDAVDEFNGRIALSTTEAAHALGITRQHLYALMTAGVIPSVHLGRRRLIRVESLRDVLAQLERGAA